MFYIFLQFSEGFVKLYLFREVQTFEQFVLCLIVSYAVCSLYVHYALYKASTRKINGGQLDQ